MHLNEKNSNNAINSSLILYPVESCENYDPTDKVSIETINKVSTSQY